MALGNRAQGILELLMGNTDYFGNTNEMGTYADASRLSDISNAYNNRNVGMPEDPFNRTPYTPKDVIQGYPNVVNSINTSDQIQKLSTNTNNVPMASDGIARLSDGTVSFGADQPVSSEKPAFTQSMFDKLYEKQKMGDQEQTQEQGGLLSQAYGGLQNMLTSEDGDINWGIVAGLNSMRHKPDATVGALAVQGMKTQSERKKSNKTADLFASMAAKETDPEKKAKLNALAGGLRDNQIDSKTAFATLYKSSGININMGEKADLEKVKYAIKDASGLIEQGNQAQTTLGELEQLQVLGNSDALNDIPFYIRGALPSGISTVVDAYQAGMVKVAKGLRVKGEGTMSDRDIALLIQGAGPISSDKTAREIAQKGLMRTQSRILERQKIANDFMSDTIDRKTYYTKLQELAEKPVFTKEDRAYLNETITRNKVPTYDSLPEEAKSQMTKEQYEALPYSKKMIWRTK